ncbi:MAG: hypothetical protein AMXMBFR58_00110 [Phycisphaerae bacterium]
MSNPYFPPLQRLFATLNVLYGMMHVQTTQSKQLAERANRYLATQNKSATGMPTLFTSTSLFVVDLDGPAWETVASGGFAAFDADFVSCITDTADHYAAFIAAQSFERFESFLWDIIAAAFLVDHGLIITRTWDKYAGKEKIATVGAASTAQLRAYARYHCRGEKIEPLVLLRAWVPQLAQVEDANLRSVRLREWFDVFATVRHAITHSDCVIAASAVASWTSEHHDHCRRYFPTQTDAESNGHRVTLCEKQTKDALLVLSDYAFAIYKQLSLRRGVRWDFRQGPV